MRTRVLLASRVGDCGALWRACWLQNPRLTTEATLLGSLDRERGGGGGSVGGVVGGGRGRLCGAPATPIRASRQQWRVP